MTEEQIKQNAANYVLNFTPTGVITEDRLKCYIAGAKSRAPQEMFDELNAEQKAEFMQENSGWSRTCDLKNELKIRNECADERPKSPWRELQKELPPVKQRVFFLDTNGIPHIGHIEIGKQIIVSADTPKDNITLTHWMPIPEIPKGE